MAHTPCPSSSSSAAPVLTPSSILGSAGSKALSHLPPGSAPPSGRTAYDVAYDQPFNLSMYPHMLNAWGEANRKPPSYEGSSRRKMERAKSRHRTDIKVGEWTKYAHAEKPPLVALEGVPPCCPSVDRVHCSNLSDEDFIARYERPGQPVMLAGLADAWPAVRRWTMEALCKDFADVKFKCGEDDDGDKIKVRLKHFAAYMAHQGDDSPLYIFDGNFDEDKVGKRMMEDFAVPRYFRDDLFRLVGEKRRPPYRWFLVGPRRSGTTLHIDPLGTSAWNTLVHGRKRWVLFPPDAPKSLVKGKKFVKDDEDDEAMDYFLNLLPRIKKVCCSEGIPVLECVQYPGDTIFVPGGWWHAVLNVDDTVAITQNFVSRTNFPAVWEQTRGGRKKMAVRFLRELDVHYPDLAAQARAMNRRDNFVMHDEKKREKAAAAAAAAAAREAEKEGKKEQQKKEQKKEEDDDDDDGDSDDDDDDDEEEKRKQKKKEKKKRKERGSDGETSERQEKREGGLVPTTSAAAAAAAAGATEGSSKRRRGEESNGVGRTGTSGSNSSSSSSSSRSTSRIDEKERKRERSRKHYRSRSRSKSPSSGGSRSRSGSGESSKGGVSSSDGR